MESAIPAHLRCPRTRDARASPDYRPPNPAYTARMGTGVKQVVMAYIGVQYRTEAGRKAAREGINHLRQAARSADAPQHHDTAYMVDQCNFETLVWVGYWRDPQAFGRWIAQPDIERWWQSDERLEEECGWFREVASPGAERFETLFSTSNGLEGVARLAEAVSGEVLEHGYWGSMRDRFAIAQTDALRGSAVLPAARPQPGRRVLVAGVENSALIRSGQDWSRTQGNERELYLKQVEPTFREGMDFLSDRGGEVGCLTNRYLTLVDDAFAPLEESYGLSWWRSLELMERWSESHPTHVAIFATFMRMVNDLNFSLQLRLYHEVTVLRAQDQCFEYINCHPETGLLRFATAAS